MSEVHTESDLPVLDAPAEVPLTVGQRLRQAREARGMQLADLAQSMKLGMRQIEALETGDWQALPGSTFVRGFVRNYARLVELDPTPLMAQLDGVLEQKRPNLALPASAPAAMPAPGGNERRDYAVAFSGVALVLIAVLLYLLFPGDLSAWRLQLQSLVSGLEQTAEPVAVTVEPPVSVLPPGASVQETLHPGLATEGADAASAVPAAPVAAADGLVPAPPEAAAATAGETATPAAAPPTLTAATAGLVIRVSKESWVEVRDRNGNVLLSQRVPDASERLLEGSGPFAVVLGNAPGVTLKFKGKDVDLTPHTKGDVARLTLE